MVWLNRFPVVLLLACTALVPLREAHAQSALPESPAPAADSARGSERALTSREETWRALPGDFLHDQKAIWTEFPVRVAHGHYLLPVVAVAGLTAGLLYADPHTMPYFRSHATNLDDLNDTFDSSIASAEIAAIPLSLLGAGYLRHDPYQVSTALLAADAYADSAIVDLAMKAVTRRERPIDVPAGTPFQDTFFHGNTSPFTGSSFPSAHAAGAFAIATVVARRYANHRWVPWTVYGVATVIGLSRISNLAHFPSDVFVGGTIGYTVARYQALRPR